MIFDSDMVERCVSVMKAKNYAVEDNHRMPFNVNIVGIRSARPVLDEFKCWISIFWQFEGKWYAESYRATTLPGKYYMIYKLLNVKGCAILKEQQIINGYKIGYHKDTYPALVQAKPFKIFRDGNQDEVFDYDLEDFGYFGINIHRAGKDDTTPKVGSYSAGCQVFKKNSDFLAFMNICEKAARNFGNRFTYTLINEQDLL